MFHVRFIHTEGLQKRCIPSVGIQVSIKQGVYMESKKRVSNKDIRPRETTSNANYPVTVLRAALHGQAWWEVHIPVETFSAGKRYHPSRPLIPQMHWLKFFSACGACGA